MLTTSRTADGKTLIPRTISMSSVRPMQRTRGPVRPHAHGLVRSSTWSRVRKRNSGAARCWRWERTSSPAAPSVDLDRRLGLGIDQLGVNEPARAEVHAVSLLALAPERDADVTDPHRLGDRGAPAALELGAEGGLAAPGLAGDEDAFDARSAKVEAPLGRPLDEVRRVGGGEHGRVGLEQLDRQHQPLGVAGPDRDVTEADPVEGRERGSGRERPRVVGGNDPFAGRDPGGRVAARRRGHPVVEVAGGQRDVARGAGVPLVE